MSAIINNRIDGLRVTIYDVLHYLEAGRSHAEISEILPLTLESKSKRPSDILMKIATR